MKAALVLENGLVFPGESLGLTGEVMGEVVFNTGMTGYQEVLTDPSYAGQIVSMTYPLIGNYGLNLDDDQSQRLQVRGFIVKEECEHPSNWRTKTGLDAALAQAGVVGLKGIDTRALTRSLRLQGTLKGMITNRTDIAGLPELLREWQPPVHLVEQVATSTAYTISGSGAKVVVMDFGIKQNILAGLKMSGFELTVVPWDAQPQDILALQPQGVFLSNGPGDPKAVPGAVATIRALVGKMPIFAICLGHQLLSLALGGDTYKLKFGHRGSNQPVQDLKSQRVYITAQNHGYAVDKASLDRTGLEISHLNLNDGTVEGLQHQELPLFSVQYHPEAGPGPSDSLYLFEQFAEMIGGSVDA
ncbi:MAG: glutamine-hydrolyzing carbamoyl-phosphate synthase small subunit [Peptococcaceae bacterium]|nr:glutamine-hydrolyzing carbamoyl-phosphate synthase small subunit [Peptococcaceae bacterium]